MADFVSSCVQRFETLARLDCDVEETERRLFGLIDTVRREADAKGLRCGRVVRRLEALAHEAEVPMLNVRDGEDQGAPLRYAGVLRRAADLLRGPEKDLTPPQVTDEKPRQSR
jgi:hypothetical protein